MSRTMSEDHEGEEEDYGGSGSIPLLPPGTGDDPRHPSRSRSDYTVALVTFSAILLAQAVALPLQYSDLGWIWKDRHLDDFLYLCRFCFLGSFALGCIASPVLVKSLRSKFVTIFMAGCIATALYIACWFVPIIYTTIIASIVAGLLLAVFYTAQGVYLTLLAYRYRAMTDVSKADNILILYNSIFYSIFLSAPLWRYLSNAIVFKPSTDMESIFNNESCYIFDYEFPDNHTDNGESLIHEIHEIQAVLGIYFTLTLLAILLLYTVLRPRETLTKPTYGQYSFSYYCSNCPDGFRVFMDTKFLLLIPMCIFLGVEQAIIYETFIQTYIGCLLPEVWTTYAIICVSATSALFSVPLGWLVGFVGRMKILLFNSALNAGLLLALLLWPQSGGQPGLLLVVAAFWGVADCIWHTQINALIGLCFRGERESAFAGCRFLEIIGILSVSLLQYFCFIKLNIYSSLVMLVVTVMCYIPFEITFRLHEQNKLRRSDSSIMLPTLESASWLPTFNPLTPGAGRQSLSSRVPGTREDSLIAPRN